MMLQVAWKEYREHRPVWLTMVAVGGVLTVGLAVVVPALESNPSAQADMLNVAMGAVGVVLTYGLVCGAMMCAGERESGTLAFLEALTGQRFPVWRAKVAAGSVFCVLQGLAVAGVVVAVAPDSPGVDPRHGFWLLPLVAVDAFVWGLLASSLCRSVLTAAGLGALFWITTLLVLMPCSLFGWPMMIGFRFLLLWLVLPCSAVLFQRTESPRRSAHLFTPPPRRLNARPPAAWQVLLWLPFRQGWGLALVLALLTLPMGLLLMPAGPLWWLAFSLLVGVLCGTATFGSEQGDGSNRFIGNQRFPMGRVWALKTAYWLVIAGAVLLLFLIIGVTTHLARNLGTTRHGNTEHDPSAFDESFLFTPGNWPVIALLGLAYGFSIGQFYALIWRKSVVAVVVALLISPGVAGVWLPSVIWGGLPLWQVLLPPALLLATSRLVLWDWASIGLRNWRPALTLAAGGLLATGSIAAALGYRAIEVPDVGEPFDAAAFKDSLPDAQHNNGRKVKLAADEIDKLRREADLPLPRQPLFPGGALAPGTTLTMQVREAIEKGWPALEPELGNWLERIFQHKAIADFKEAVALPPGFIDDPTSVSLRSPKIDALRCKDVAELFEARALQLQARGDDAAALEHLLVLLPLSRHMRSRALAASYYLGVAVEMGATRGLEGWLAHKKHDPRVLRRVLAELIRHESEAPPRSETVKAEYLRFRHQFEVLPRELKITGYSETELEMASASWATPWERQRQLRLANAFCAATLKKTERDPWETTAMARDWANGPRTERPEAWQARRCGLADPDGTGALLTAAQWGRLLNDSPLWNFGAFEGFRLAGDDVRGLEQVMSLCRLHALQILFALVIHEAEQRQTAPELDDLVRGGQLTALPVDPFSGQPFHYRVSAGERINWPSGREEGVFQLREVPAGQAVLWSVGPDGVDHGGVKHGGSQIGGDYRRWAQDRLDLIFLVPRW
jgi:hypothetical protein